MKPKELIRLLEKEGWQIIRIGGSHHIMRHPDKRLVVIPLHNRDMKPGLLTHIMKMAGLRKEERQ